MPPLEARALVLDEPRRLTERRFAIPEIGDDDGVLRVEACGLCGTDHEQYTGELHPGYAFVPGHETVGIVEEVGPRAAERWDVQAGDRVAVEVFLSCRECAACRAGAYRRCAQHGLRDMYGFVPADREPGLWGGYAEYQYLAPDSLVLSVPAVLDPVVATIFNPLGAGIRWAVTVPELQPGAIVAVLGPGIRGLSAAAAAKDAGAGFVMVTGLGSRDGARLEIAPQFGADLVVDVETGRTGARVARRDGRVGRRRRRRDGEGAGRTRAGDRDGTCGRDDRARGTRGSLETPGFVPDVVVYKELHLVGALGVDAPAYRAALAMLASGRYPFADLDRRVVGLDGVDELLQSMAGDGPPPPVHGVVTP